MKIFSIRDSKAESYLQPFFSPNVATAIRAVSQAANEPGHNFNNYAQDYDLYQVASFDEMTGKIAGLDSPQHVVKLVDIIESRPASLGNGLLPGKPPNEDQRRPSPE